jgi:hypothetical protein
MPLNIGEEICGEWLRWMRGCEFIQGGWTVSSSTPYILWSTSESCQQRMP